MILQHMEFSYQNSYVMPELAVIMQTFCITLDLLQLGCWNRVMLLQNWSYMYHCRGFMVVIINLWTITVYPSAPWDLVCATCPFTFLFRLPWTWLLMSNLAGVSRKAEDAYLIHALGPYPQSGLLIYCCYFVCIILVFSCYLLHMSFSMSRLCLWITFFWFPQESWFPWLTFILESKPAFRRTLRWLSVCLWYLFLSITKMLFNC